MNYSIQQLLNNAFQAFQSNNLEQAAALLESSIKIDSRCLPAIQLLALIKASQNNFFEAQKLLKKAVNISPNDPSLNFNLAKALSDGNKDAESLPYHQKAIALAPQNIDAKLNYSKSLMQCGRSDEALTIINGCLESIQNREDLWINKGALLNNLNQFNEAIKCFDNAIQLNPKCSEAFYNKGISFSKLSSAQQAIENFTKAIDLNNKYYQAFTNLGLELGKIKKYDEALQAFDAALHIKPDHIECLVNKSFILYSTHQHNECIATLNKALDIQPNNTSCLSNKALSLALTGNLDDALICANKAVKADPNNTDALFNKCNIYTRLKKIPEAIASLESLIKVAPSYRIALSNLLYLKMQICSWADYKSLKQELIQKLEQQQAIALPFMLLALTDAEHLHKLNAEAFIGNFHSPANIPDLSGNKINQESSNQQKVKIGYFSADFHDHPMARLMASVYEHHDKSRFEITAFSLGFPDKSALRSRIIDSFDYFYDVREKSDQEIALLSRELGIDIAIDLNGFTDNARTDIFMHRAAPIQINYLGYPGTMGAGYIDYIIADKQVIPLEAATHYTEKVLYLPGCYQPNDGVITGNQNLPTKAQYGLPESGFVFCCFNNNYKINPETFDAWMKILSAVEGSVLWLLEDNLHAKQNLINEATCRGVDSKRLIFATRVSLKEHLERHQLADLFLDTFPYNAHTTASDAIRTGLPLLTLQGNSFASRVAGSILNASNLPELITNSWSEYISKAIVLAKDAEKIPDLKLKLSKEHKDGDFFKIKVFTKHLEDTYLELLKKN